MKAQKPLFSSSSNLDKIDQSGNRRIYKATTLNGTSVVLQFVVRSDKDIKDSHHQCYRLLVP